MFYYGIAFSIIGTGFLNLMFSMVGELYHEDDPEEMQVTECSMQELILWILGGICVFIWEILLLATLFLASAIVMVLGLLTFFIY